MGQNKTYANSELTITVTEGESRLETSKLIMRILRETPGSNSTFSITYDNGKPWQELHFSTL